MKRTNLTIWVMLVLVTLMTWGCGSSRDSSGTVVGGSDTLANAETLGITNCLTCHNTSTAVTDSWLNSRHGNPDDSPSTSDTDCTPCHDPLGDGLILDQADIALVNRMVIGCESCHGGGQFHYGIPSGIPFPAPGPDQCGECHGLDGVELDHVTSAVRNISDTHYDDPATTSAIEGYVVRGAEQSGCVECHFNGHDFDLTINDQWGRSAHSGHILDVKDAASTTDVALRKAVGVEAATGDGWVHYDWDDSAGNGPGGRDRGSCQRCHTTTGLVAFLADSANYNDDNNDFSYLDGWTAAKWSGQNEMLYCWGCHADSKGTLRDDASGITLDFLYEDETGASGPATFVVLPDKGNSNVCAACHSGRGNNTSIRSSYAEEAAAAAADGIGGELGGLSSRFSGHHAPTAGSLYAAITRTGFEFTDPAAVIPGTPLDYSTPLLEHDQILEDTSGPCAGCHMAGNADHHFAALDRTGPTVINNQALCDTCHDGGALFAVDGTFIDATQADFAAARTVLDNLVDNVTTNYLNLDISLTANRNAETLALNDFGAFQNSLYLNEEPCIYVHNSLYAKRLMFDSIDWLEDGSLDGTITPNLAWFGGTVRP